MYLANIFNYSLKKMENLLSAVVLCFCIYQVSSQTEDFAFEQESSTAVLPPLKRLWGIPDSTAQAGTLVHITIPSDAFEGVITRYEVSFHLIKSKIELKKLC